VNPQEPTTDVLPGLLVGLATMAVMAYGAVILGLQAFLWLTLGVWHEVPLLTLFGAGPTDYPHLLGRWLPNTPISPAFSAWLREPSTWLGLHRVLHAVLSGGGVGYALFFGSWFAWFGFLALTDRRAPRSP
jgi:hypothetical protein